MTLDGNGAIAIAVVAALLLLVVLVLRARSKSGVRTRHRAPDALDEGVAPAARNQALIDAPSAAARVAAHAESAQIAARFADTGAGIIGGIGSAIASAAGEEAAGEEAAKAPAAEVAAVSDDLTRLKGIGPKLSTRLGDLGVTSFAQIAAWTEADIAAVDAQLGAFAGRCTRDNWVEQARFLASGDVAGYEAKFGKL